MKRRRRAPPAQARKERRALDLVAAEAALAAGAAHALALAPALRAAAVARTATPFQARRDSNDSPDARRTPTPSARRHAEPRHL
jgi:hypothetical protein